MVDVPIQDTAFCSIKSISTNQIYSSNFGRETCTNRIIYQSINALQADPNKAVVRCKYILFSFFSSFVFLGNTCVVTIDSTLLRLFSILLFLFHVEIRNNTFSLKNLFSTENQPLRIIINICIHILRKYIKKKTNLFQLFGTTQSDLPRVGNQLVYTKKQVYKLNICTSYYNINYHKVPGKINQILCLLTKYFIINLKLIQYKLRQKCFNDFFQRKLI